MNITVLLFGILKDIIEENSLKLQIENDTTIDDLKEHLLKEYDKLNSFSNFSVAVNEEYVDLNYILKNNDIVALVPPVSGG
ncbi:MAG: molybdopterin converting factor subunit 1 [Flavobacteriaceae bacterium]|nr:molybdopterin converting factor subunit 1 [Flavobacteriaceae bacterium]